LEKLFCDGSLAATTFTPTGELVYTTQYYSTLPDPQLVSLNLSSGERHRIELSQASEGSFDASGKTLYFVRPPFHNNVTRWYTGGTARQIWKYRNGTGEAEKLTGDYAGESHTPMWCNGRVYFVTDRDGTMNLWSMHESGGDLRQHTDHKGWDVRFASLDAGRICMSWLRISGSTTRRRTQNTWYRSHCPPISINYARNGLPNRCRASRPRICIPAAMLSC
jgi:tricorn protease